MINELFDYDGWDEAGDFGDMILYNPTLKQQIGDYPIGTKFWSAELLHSKGVLNFYIEEDDNDLTVVASFKVKLQIVGE